MIFDKYISFTTKIIISMICGGLWIYFRTQNCYDMIPRHHIFPVLFVAVWIYLNYYDPLFLPLGLGILLLYTNYQQYSPGTQENITVLNQEFL
jgi:hypothetical protein